MQRHSTSSFFDWTSRGFIRQIPALLLGLSLCSYARPLQAAPVPTTTVLQVSPTAVRAQAPITLTATVTANGAAVTPGQVLFCDAAATRCQDLAILGMAQLTSNGTASINLRLWPGRHDIYAKFTGTLSYASSTSHSAIQTVEVTGSSHTTATVSKYGTVGDYTLAAAVTAFGRMPPSGTVSFLDAMTNRELASAPLDSHTLQAVLTQSKIYSTGLNPWAVAVGDFNNDGLPDLAITNYVNDGFVSVMLGDPSHPGQFLPEQRYSTSARPSSIAVGDFNSDGVLDLAIVTGQGPGSVSVLLGDAADPGHFLPQQLYTTGDYGSASIVVGDFNGDGRPDLAVANYGKVLNYGNAPSNISLLFADPARPGQFLPQQLISTGFNSETIISADFNGDGVLDLAVGGDMIGVLLGDPAHPGSFLAPVKYAAGPAPRYLTAGDFNGDGLPDLAVASWEIDAQLQILLADPAHPGTLLAPVSFPHPNLAYMNAIVIGDFNGDGVLDVAVSFLGAYDPYAPGLGLYPGDPAHPGRFLPVVFYPIPNIARTSPGTSAVADLNRDGMTDIALPENPNATSIFLGALTETTTAQHVNPGSTSYFYASYGGDNNYYGYQTCEIGLSAGYSPVKPAISGVTVSGITQNSATISWTSDVATYGGVNYGTTTALDSKTSWVNPVSVSHSFVLSNLKPGTTYDYLAWSVAFFSGCTYWTTFSPAAAFTTAAAP